MLSKFISLGDRIELQAVERRLRNDDDEKQRVYQSKVYEILSEDTLEITMPMEKTKLILLPVDGEYDMVFYGTTGLYQCFARIADRYKSNNVYILRVELTSNLRKYQRREYYRFSCALEMCSRSLEEEEVQAVESKSPYMLQPGLPLKRSIIVDISGGGLRFVSDQKYEPGSLVYCNYHLLKNGQNKLYEVIGKVLSAQELANKPGSFEHRVQYYNMDVTTREEIIRFIFEEERRSRQKRD
ncbi:MAG: flagellar brake protein [Lachnospiraceae bacterium]|nr:flagellar brake protein [Lachnospiraceae bacterium]